MEKQKTKTRPMLGVALPQAILDRYKAACQARLTTMSEDVRRHVMKVIRDTERKPQEKWPWR
jgi:hypothetical protein